VKPSDTGVAVKESGRVKPSDTGAPVKKSDDVGASNTGVSLKKPDDVEQMLSSALGSPVRSFLDAMAIEPNLSLICSWKGIESPVAEGGIKPP